MLFLRQTCSTFKANFVHLLQPRFKPGGHEWAQDLCQQRSSPPGCGAEPQIAEIHQPDGVGRQLTVPPALPDPTQPCPLLLFLQNLTRKLSPLTVDNILGRKGACGVEGRVGDWLIIAKIIFVLSLFAFTSLTAANLVHFPAIPPHTFLP